MITQMLVRRARLGISNNAPSESNSLIVRPILCYTLMQSCQLRVSITDQAHRNKNVLAPWGASELKYENKCTVFYSSSNVLRHVALATTNKLPVNCKIANTCQQCCKAALTCHNNATKMF